MKCRISPPADGVHAAGRVAGAPRPTPEGKQASGEDRLREWAGLSECARSAVGTGGCRRTKRKSRRRSAPGTGTRASSFHEAGFKSGPNFDVMDVLRRPGHGAAREGDVITPGKGHPHAIARFGSTALRENRKCRDG